MFLDISKLTTIHNEESDFLFDDILNEADESSDTNLEDATDTLEDTVEEDSDNGEDSTNEDNNDSSDEENNEEEDSNDNEDENGTEENNDDSDINIDGNSDGTNDNTSDDDSFDDDNMNSELDSATPEEKQKKSYYFNLFDNMNNTINLTILKIDELVLNQSDNNRNDMRILKNELIKLKEDIQFLVIKKIGSMSIENLSKISLIFQTKIECTIDIISKLLDLYKNQS